jgi:hypothetical protein
MALLRRASEVQTARTPAETPLEFAQKLERTYPDTAADVRAMTSVFETARYTQDEIAPEDLAAMKTRWQRVRRALREAR